MNKPDNVVHLGVAEGRLQGLEEAAQMLDRCFVGGLSVEEIAFAVRALKDKPSTPEP